VLCSGGSYPRAGIREHAGPEREDRKRPRRGTQEAPPVLELVRAVGEEEPPAAPGDAAQDARGQGEGREGHGGERAQARPREAAEDGVDETALQEGSPRLTTPRPTGSERAKSASAARRKAREERSCRSERARAAASANAKSPFAATPA
jgi:hypothetical protein